MFPCLRDRSRKRTRGSRKGAPNITGFIRLHPWRTGASRRCSIVLACCLRSDFRDRLSAIFRALHGVRRHDAGDDVPGLTGSEFFRGAAVAEATIDAEYWLHTLGQRVLYRIFVGLVG